MLRRHCISLGFCKWLWFSCVKNVTACNAVVSGTLNYDGHHSLLWMEVLIMRVTIGCFFKLLSLAN